MPKKTTLRKNKELVAKYPFLQYRNVFDGELIPIEELNFTYLDDLPKAWRKITIDLCEKIKNHLVETNRLDEYRLIQVKSKFGYGHWYDCGADEFIEDLVHEWESLTSSTCEWCGKPAKWISCGWISPYCDECKAEALQDSPNMEFDEMAPIKWVKYKKG